MAKKKSRTVKSAKKEKKTELAVESKESKDLLAVFENTPPIIEQSPMGTASSASPTAAEQKNTERTLNIIYGGVAIIAVVLILGGLLWMSLGKVTDESNSLVTPWVPGTNSSGLEGGIGLLDVEIGAMPLLGSANAPVAIIEFSDYQCPYCREFYKQTEKKVVTNYVNTGKVKISFRDLPLSMHDKAKPMALATRCANEQNKFWEMHDKIFDKQSDWSMLPKADALDKAKGYAVDLGLNVQQFNDCMDTQKYYAAIETDVNYFIGKFGSPSTPISFVVMPKSKVSDISALKSLQKSYPENIVVGQNKDNYVIGCIGALPYDMMKVVLDSAKYS